MAPSIVEHFLQRRSDERSQGAEYSGLNLLASRRPSAPPEPSSKISRHKICTLKPG